MSVSKVSVSEKLYQKEETVSGTNIGIGKIGIGRHRYRTMSVSENISVSETSVSEINRYRKTSVSENVGIGGFGIGDVGGGLGKVIILLFRLRGIWSSALRLRWS